MKTLREMLAEARQAIREEGPEDLQARRPSGEPLVLIEVRDPDEDRDGYIEPAVNISRGFLEFRIGTAAPDPSVPIILYCQTGLRSALAAKALTGPGARPPPIIAPPPGSARSGSWTATAWTSPISSARSSTGPPTSAAPRWSRLPRRSGPSTPTPP